MNTKKIIINKTPILRKSMKNIDKDLFDIKKQVSMVNQLYLDETFKGKCEIKKAFQKKLQSYKSQDQRHNRYHSADFITLEELNEKLVISKLKCHYCFQHLLIMYNNIREESQWTLDRIDNNLEHTASNTVIACLKCNIQRGRLCNKKFLFTKQLRLIKKY
jgi:hypothetical protein